jgi:hypothetical protein
MTTFSPSDAALEGFRIVRANPKQIAVWMAFNFLAFALLLAIAAVLFGSKVVALIREGEAENEAQMAEQLLAGGAGPFAVLALMFVGLLISSMVIAAVFRIVFGSDEKTLFGLRLGADELRLVIVSLGLLPLFFAGRLLLNLTVYMTEPGTGWIYFAAMLFGFAVLIWITVRLSLVAPLTFLRQHLAFREGWILTRGRFWPLLGMMILASIFWIIVVALILIVNQVVLTLGGGAGAIGDFDNITAVTFAAFLIGLGLSLLMPVLQVIMLAAPLAVACKAIVDPSEEATPA